MKAKYIPQFFLSFFLIIMLFGSTANASIITTLYHDFQLATDSGNPFGVSDGATVTVGITFDEANGYFDGDYTIHTLEDGTNDGKDTSDSSFALSFSLGTSLFTAEDDVWYPNWPAVTIKHEGTTSNTIESIEFEAIRAGYEIFIGIPVGGNQMVMTANPIPEPGTFTLLSFAVLSLAGLQRKRFLK